MDTTTRVWVPRNKTEWMLIRAGYAVYGYIFQHDDGRWGWEARTDVKYRLEDMSPARGFVNTFEQAKQIVELLLEFTGTP